MDPDPAHVDCLAASRLLSLACERELTSAESQALRYHLDRCVACRNFESQLEFIHRASERLRSGK